MMNTEDCSSVRKSTFRAYGARGVVEISGCGQVTDFGQLASQNVCRTSQEESV